MFLQLQVNIQDNQTERHIIEFARHNIVPMLLIGALASLYAAVLVLFILFPTAIVEMNSLLEARQPFGSTLACLFLVRKLASTNRVLNSWVKKRTHKVPC